ncbi:MULTISPECIES: phosphoribosylanthranilate isomerase [unclassified Neorhizobium]|uniref:phosphoribosylanthranilate isomerase n=1 Tax=unclassified Neorhizobium TaxID=2629175 RepID=UPI001FF41AF1|nr:MULTISPECIES: phosphoribosylanthranilate isomerase [unclassified Neorhizobium]MCJ9674142.1 phosphoribosylanthranilate isomerase [Neorhizobium sp. SHOUNA12B]MCJ9748915.1 phosphoribosylanthranilate isomerase [Neorhizobium sp. SHOUNA12A]
MLRVKVCGITRQEDAFAAVRAGADAIGLQFYGKSTRHVTPEQGRSIRKQLPPFLSVVGVFVNAEREEILRTVQCCRLDYIQLHGDEGPEYFVDMPAKTIKVVRVGGAEDLKGLERYSADALLLDAKVGNQYGGTGQCFDWSLLNGLTTSVPLILAGGLRPGNIEKAVRDANPQAVDVSSGVESAPAVKSYEKMRLFIEKARSAARSGHGGIDGALRA